MLVVITLREQKASKHRQAKTRTTVLRRKCVICNTVIEAAKQNKRR